MSIKCLIVDDEPIARQIIAGYVEKVPYLEAAGSCSTALEALEVLKKQAIGLLFLDINMPHLSGLSMLRSLKHRPDVIITTAYPEYALEGFELAVTDYLLKPFSLERFLQAVERVAQSRQPEGESTSAFARPEEEALFLKTSDKIVRVRLADILYAEAYGNYTKLHLEAERLLLTQPLGQLADSLPEGRFVRIHKSYLISMHRLESIEGNRLTVGGTQLPIGKIYKQALMRQVRSK